MNFRRIALAAAVAMAALVPGASAEELNLEPRLREVPASLLAWLARTPSLEEFLGRMMQTFRNAAGPDNVLRAAELAEAAARQDAAARAQALSAMLAADLDADGTVTRDEALRVARLDLRSPEDAAQFSVEAKVAKMARQAMQADADGDGALTLVEMLQAASRKIAMKGSQRDGEGAGDLIHFDADRDGNVTLAEMRREPARLFASIDEDGDGLLGVAERRQLGQLVQQRNRARQEAAMLAACSFPKPLDGQKIMVLQADRGLEIPLVSVTGVDETTWSASIGIEPGTTPLWLMVMANDAMLWRFEGDAARIAQLVVVPSQRNDIPAAGVTGLPRDKVHFLDTSTCGIAHFAANKQRLAAALPGLLGRAPDLLLQTDSFYTATLPGGGLAQRAGHAAIIEKPAAMPDQAWVDLRNAAGSRVVPMTPAEVVSLDRAESYDVLPQQAGLIQLVAEGAIVVKPVSAYISFDIKTLAAKRRDGYVYEIVQPIKRFPAGLFGGNAVTFMLARDVPMPSGNPGHSCVLSGVTGKVLFGGQRCGE